MHLNVVTTLRCNLRCPHCIVGCPQEVDLDPGSFRRAVDDLRVQGLTSVTFTGGEPALHPQLETLVRDAAASELSIGFVSNGGYATRYRALLRRRGAGAGEMAVSLDGVGAAHDSVRGHGSFHQAIQAIRTYVNEGIVTTVNFTVRDENVGELGTAVALAASLGTHGVKVAGLLPTPTHGARLSSDHRATVHAEAARLAARYQIPVNVANSVFHPVTVEFCPVLTHDVLTLDAEGYLTFCCDVPCPSARLGNVATGSAPSLRRRRDLIDELLLHRILQARDGTLTEEDQSCLYCLQRFGAPA